MEHRTTIQAAQTKYAVTVFLGRQPKCDKDTGVVRIDCRPAITDRKEAGSTQVVVFKPGEHCTAALIQLLELILISREP